MSPSVADPRWERLTASSKAALRWAAASAQVRDAHAPADSLDLLAGIMLAHLRDSPPRQLFAHFDIPPGAVLARDGTPPPRADALLAAFRRLPSDEPPPGAADIEIVLSGGIDAMPPESDGLVSLRTLFGALLWDPAGPATNAIRAQLAARGADADAVVGSYRDFLAGRDSYAEFLRALQPYRPRAVELPAYQPDQPRERRKPAEPAADPPDLVGITAEVDAFAYLIASKRLAPPLAVGLFGDWGGGKSYFLRSVQRRIDELISDTATAGRPPEALPFHRSIVQVEYNAWQYVEGDLWSSLLEHLFRNLGPTGEQSDDLLAQRQRSVIEQLRRTGEEHDAARLERGQLEDKLRVAAAEVTRREREREVALAELERRRREQQPRVVVSGALREAIGSVVQQAGLGTVATEADGLADELRQAGDTLRSAGPVLASLRTGGWRYLIAVIVLLALPPVVALVLDRFDFSAVTAVAASLATFLATAAAYVRKSSDLLTARLADIAEQQRKLDAELTAGRATLDAEVTEAQDALDAVEEQLRAAADVGRRLNAEAAALEVQLAATTPNRVLGEFLTERLGSDDYRSRLGVPALVRRDLARLSMLIQQRHSATAQSPAGAEQGIDRIVLYIDDLDRCPTRLVIDVLQAVHLLLAFPLFVVVVAVDTRWLARSLREHYRQLDGTDASPEDFIEKIFQVPFRVRPLGPDARRRMVSGLVTPSVAPDPATAAAPSSAAGPTSEPLGPADVAAADLPELTRLVASFADTAGHDPPWLDAASLTVSADELRWIERAAPLLGDTPRAVKRFANVYLLLRSVGRGRGWLLPPDGQIVVLLALATGLPRLADALFPRIEQATTGPVLLPNAMPTTDDAGPPIATERRQLQQWLDDEPAAKDIDLSDLTDWIDLIRRFRFDR